MQAGRPQDAQTFGGEKQKQVEILTAGACGEPWLDFVVLRGKKKVLVVVLS